MMKLLTLSLTVMCTTVYVSAWYYCHGDICDGEADFCSDDFRQCRPCIEVLDDCLTNRLPKNCTRVCIQDKFEEQMKKERERKCDKPKPLLNGNHNGSQKEQYDQGDVITVTCNPGYWLDSKNTITCKAFGVWSNDLPTCAETTCPNLSPIRNGFWSFSRNSNGRHVAGDIVKAVCDEGYFMDGAVIWNCSNDGNWISSCLYFPLCLPFGETEAYNGWKVAFVILGVCVSIFAVTVAFCCKQMCKQKREERHEKCEDIEMTDSNENTELLESFENKESLDSIMESCKTYSFRHLNENQERKSLSCPDLPQQFITSKQPNTRPEGRTREEFICPVQPESSRDSIIENDTCRKTFPENTFRAVAPSCSLNLRFPEQQATNNEQDLAQKLAITSDDINRDDIA